MAGPGSKSKRHYKENLSKSFQEKKFLFRNVKFELMRGRGVMAGPGSCNSPRQTGSDVCRPGLAHRPILSKTKTKTVTKARQRLTLCKHILGLYFQISESKKDRFVSAQTTYNVHTPRQSLYNTNNTKCVLLVL